ncbi:hypothetical protein H0H93_006860 [Arthromyces matolae]|nr:hypothetical protein H0H93_006860 [Arthromyces matolae]
MTAGSLINMHCENDNTSKGRTVAETAPLLPHHNAWPSNATVSSITMFWEELRSIPQSALPVLGSVLLEFSFTGVQVISVGHISTPALAAVSLGSMTANVTGMSIISGLASALDTLLPSAYTSSRPELVGLWSQRMAEEQDRLNDIVLTTKPILVTWWRAESILLFLKQDPEIARLAALYLRWFTIALPAVVFNHISRPASNRVVGMGDPGTRSFLLSMGPVAMASQSIILTSAVGTWHVGNAVTCASGVRVGNLLGSKNPRRARAAANASILMVLFTSLMLSSVYMTFRHSWAKVFSRDPEVIKTVASVIPLIAFFQIVDANTCLTGGLLRATGRQAFHWGYTLRLL